jgi:hypothetical protein
MQSFQDFADETGITTGFRMNNRNLSLLAQIYDEWRAHAAPSEWECGEIIQYQRVPERGSIRITLSSGAVFEVVLRRSKKACGKR